MSIILTKELLLQEIPKMKEQFSWARKNMLKCEPDTPEHKKRLNLMMHLGLQVIEMEAMAKSAPSEQED